MHHWMFIKAWETKVGILVDSSSRHGYGLSSFCDSLTLLLILSYIFSEFLYLTGGEQNIVIISFCTKEERLFSKIFLTSYNLIFGRENEVKDIFIPS